MYDMYWWTEDGDAGQVGTTAQIGLPSDETILTAGHGLVVSGRLHRTGWRCDDGCTLIVRNIRTGETVRRVQTNLMAPEALILPGRLFWAGVDGDRSDINANVVFDGGVWTAALDGGEPVVVVAPGQNVSSFNYAGRFRFGVSPSGRTVVSGVGGFADRFTDVIDVETLSRTRLPNIAPYAVTDELIVTGEHPPSDYPSGGILAIETETGDIRWRFPDRADADQFELTNVEAKAGSFYLAYLWRKGGDQLRLGAIDAGNGQSKVLFSQTLGRDTRPLWAMLGISTDRHVAFGTDLSALGYLVQSGEASISILDVETGRLTENAFTVEPAFMCFGRYCLRY
jgi:hypothetical protein